MKEFNERVKEILLRSDARREATPKGELLMVSPPTKKLNVRSYRFYHRLKGLGNIKPLGRQERYNASHRCEICDWCHSTHGSTYLDTSGHDANEASHEPGERLRKALIKERRPSRVTYDKSSDRHLCNVCRGESDRLVDENKIIDKTKDLQHNELQVKKRLDRFYDHSYLDVIGDEIVEVKVYRPTHPKLR